MLLLPGPETAGSLPLVPELRTVTPEGDLHLVYSATAPVVRAASRARGDELPVVLELTDVAPVSVPHRVRGRAWVSGWLTRLPDDAPEAHAVAGPAGPGGPAWATLRLEPYEIRVDDLWDVARVDIEDFAAAAPDPLREYEAELLQHLHAAHAPAGAAVARPARRAGRGRLPRGGAARARPLRAARPLHRSALLRRALRLPRAGERRARPAPRHGSALRRGGRLRRRGRLRPAPRL
ncbi:LOW QUALITY PROTEIN: conserved hypothetical protein, partial [Streptomyces sp. SPB78]